VLVALVLAGAASFGTGLASLWRPRLAWVFSAASLAFAASTLVALVAVVAPYVYEQPHHHCPFCLLQRGHGAVGYPLYLLLFAGLVLGGTVGPLGLLEGRQSLRGILPAWRRGQVLAALACQLVLLAMFAWLAVRSNLRLLHP
jgi:hypothetical protein